MNTAPPFQARKKIETINAWVIGLALMTGLILSILSWLEICIESCSATRQYRLFRLPFAEFGVAFFVTIISMHVLLRKYPKLGSLTGWMVASALGAEAMFVIVQKYQIGTWCPVCISIAGALVVAGLALTIPYLKGFILAIKTENKGEIMHKIRTSLTSLSFFAIGFLVAFIGISKPNLAQAAAEEMKERLAFGNTNSPIEVYFVTDWFCPACRKIEPQIEKLYPSIQSKVTFYFIDYPIHSKSMNFVPYNLSFLLHNKSQYFEARHLLTELTKKTEKPTDPDIVAAAKKTGIPYEDLSFLDVKAGMDYFDGIVKKYQLSSTPIVILTHTKTKKTITLDGLDEISSNKILKAIETLNN